jgi:hypothetical protein
LENTEAQTAPQVKLEEVVLQSPHNSQREKRAAKIKAKRRAKNKIAKASRKANR